MNVGSYTISEEYLRASIESNRAMGVAGEAYFFYEGLRQNNNAPGRYAGQGILLRTGYDSGPEWGDSSCGNLDR